MMLWLALLLFAAGLFCLAIDRKMAHYFREHLATPVFRFALKITDKADTLPAVDCEEPPKMRAVAGA